MKYSEERIAHLASKIHDRLYLDNFVDYLDENKSLANIKQTMMHYFQAEDAIDQKVCEKVMSLKKNVVRGSTEWDVLYRKYYEEEMRKHKL